MQKSIGKTNWLWAATVVTLIYLIGLVIVIGPGKISAFVKTDSLNEIGDFIAGVYSRRWLLFGWLQRYSLNGKSLMKPANSFKPTE